MHPSLLPLTSLACTHGTQVFTRIIQGAFASWPQASSQRTPVSRACCGALQTPRAAGGGSAASLTPPVTSASRVGTQKVAVEEKKHHQVPVLFDV